MLGADELILPRQIAPDGAFLTHEQAPTSHERTEIREALRRWISRGNLDDHVHGVENRDTRLLNNVRSGGMLLPTHSTNLEGAAAILNSGYIDPTSSRTDRAYFRYGLGHSYGPIVFVQAPGIDALGSISDLWGVMSQSLPVRAALYQLVKRVEFNKNIPIKNIAAEEYGPEGRSAMLSPEHWNTFMELFPQFESAQRISVEHTYLVLAPDHLYTSLLNEAPSDLRHLIVCIRGTGDTETDFLASRDRIARRTRLFAGSFQPLIGREALVRYELAYFKTVEMIVRRRHLQLKQHIGAFAQRAAQSHLTPREVEAHIRDIVGSAPEIFRALHHQTQNPSHDGHSPLSHTLNALIEAAYALPHLAALAPSLRAEDVFLALLFHDTGKIVDARFKDHAKYSVDLARYHLKMMNLHDGAGSGEARQRAQRIEHLIRHGDIISRYSLAREEGAIWHALRERLAADSDPLLFEGELVLPELFLFNFADVASIPGRSGRMMMRNRTYRGVVDARPHLVDAFELLMKELPRIWARF